MKDTLKDMILDWLAVLIIGCWAFSTVYWVTQQNWGF
jgi:hypothetical protein